MKKITLLFTTLMLILVGCKKDEQNTLLTDNNIITQNIIIEKKLYVLNSKLNKELDEIEFVDAPIEITDFFNRYDETFVPYVFIKEGITTIVYFKDENELNETITFNNMSESRPKGQNNAYQDSHIHSNLQGWKFTGQNWHYKTYNFNSVYAWGNSSSYVGSQANDEISSVALGRIGSQAPTQINYMGCEHSNYGGKKFYLSNYDGWGSINLSEIKFNCCFKTWNDKISSLEFWESTVSVNGITI